MKLHPHLLAFAGLTAAAFPLHAAPQVTTAAGATPAEIQPAVDAFRAKLGANNGANAGPFASGFRNLNWDGVPDSVARPNLMPQDFFKSTTPRGVEFTTPGTGVTNSAKAVNPTGTAVRFADLNPAYATSFQTFSAERLFSPLGSTIVLAQFYVPSSPTTMGYVNGFGVVFADVDLANSATLEFFTVDNKLLGKFAAPVANNGLSFLGVYFDAGERVAFVRITHGTLAIDAGKPEDAAAGLDVVVADDYMFSEPQPLVSLSRLINLSTRGQAGGTTGPLIAGFVIDGNQPKSVLVRGVGPALTGFGVAGAHPNPTLAVFNAAGQQIAANDDWGNVPAVAQAAAQVGAFALPAGSTDAATVLVLNPGAYTLQVSGATSAGQVLAEIYEIR